MPLNPPSHRKGTVMAQTRFALRPVGSMMALAALACCLPVAAGLSQSKDSGDWLDSANWTDGIPGAGTAAVIAGHSLYLEGFGGAFGLNIDGMLRVRTSGVPKALPGTLGLQFLAVGSEALGGLELSKGGRIFTVDALIGYHPGSNGNISVDGQPSVDGDHASFSSTGKIHVGSAGFGPALGSFGLSNSGTVNSFDTSIGNGLSNGRVDIDNATWTNTNLFKVGSGAPSGTLSISRDGVLNTLTGVIGYGSGGGSALATTQGSALLDHSRWNNSGDFSIGLYARGDLTVINGGAIQNAWGHIGYGEFAVGNARISASTWRNQDGLIVGDLGQGTLLIEKGATVSSPWSALAAKGIAKGTVTVDDANWITAGELYIAQGGPDGSAGRHAEGTLTVRNGGFVSSANGRLGHGEGSLGIVTVTGTHRTSGRASEWNVRTDITVGGDGRGVLTVDDGGVVRDRLTVLADQGDGRLVLNGSAGHRGTLETEQVMGVIAARTELSFDGGVLRSTADQTDFLRFVPNVTVKAGGAYIDSNQHRIGTNASFVGPGGLHKIGGGAFDFRGLGFFGSLSQVEGGSLLVNGRLSGDVEVGAGATLGGNGEVGGLVTVLAGGTLSPGNSPGTLALGTLALAPGSSLLIELGDPSDRVVVAGDLTLGGKVDFIGDASVLLRGSFQFLTYGGVLLDKGLVIGSLPGGLNPTDYRFDLSTAGALGLAAVMAVPEPATTLLMAAGVLMLLAFRRYRFGSAATLA